MARKSTGSRAGQPDQHQIWLYLAWALLAGCWMLLAMALISYDPGDWPGRFIAPHNPEPHNWVGQVGARVADELYTMIGPGVWILMAGYLAALVVKALRRPITQLVLRTVGLILMSIGTSSLVDLSLSSSSNHLLPGGLIAGFIATELIMRFSIIGTLIILLVGFWIGAILAMDQVLTVLGRTVIRYSSIIAAWVRIPRPVLVGKLSRFNFAGIGIADARTKLTIPIRTHSKTLRRKGSDETESAEIDPDPDGHEDRAVPESNGDQSEGSAKDADHPAATDAPSAYQATQKQFTPDELRVKIKQLPINFASKIRHSAPPPQEVDLSGYRFPDLALLEEPETSFTQEMERLVRDQAVDLESALQQYGIAGEVVGIDSGPVITLFEVRLAPGTKVAQINTIASDLARALKAHNIRIVPNMTGKDTVGIEVPNLKKEQVRLKELMTASTDLAKQMKLPMWLGKDASGNPLIADLAAMPHMLMAGTTGSGKSVCMNSIIMSFLFTRRPDDLKLVLVDPKMVEMSMFREIPHLMCPVVTEVSRAAAILEWATTKMDERYEVLAEAGVRDIAAYNELTWDELVERFQPSNDAEKARIPRKLPYIVFVVDELADLMMTAKEVEGFIVRLAQKSRAVGMHLILATQRPQATVVTGLIKSNMPCRVSFKVASRMDSRIVLDHNGAELLLGQGDMLYLSPRTSKITRAQGTLVDDIEIRRTIRFLKTVAAPSFEPQLMQLPSADLDQMAGEKDPLFDEAVTVVLETRRGSVSLLQRRLTIGYSRASRLIEQMAQAGILGDYKGSQAREVQMTAEEWQAIRAQAEADAAAEDPVGTHSNGPETDGDCQTEEEECGEKEPEVGEYKTEELEYDEGKPEEEEWDDEEDDEEDDEKDEQEKENIR